MDEQLRLILIIIVSVSIFGLLVFVFVKNYIRNKINQLIKDEKDKNLKFVDDYVSKERKKYGLRKARKAPQY